MPKRAVHSNTSLAALNESVQRIAILHWQHCMQCTELLLWLDYMPKRAVQSNIALAAQQQFEKQTWYHPPVGTLITLTPLDSHYSHSPVLSNPDSPVLSLLNLPGTLTLSLPGTLTTFSPRYSTTLSSWYSHYSHSPVLYYSLSPVL